MGICHLGILVDEVEDIADGVTVDVSMCDGCLTCFIQGEVGDITVGLEKVLKDLGDGTVDGASEVVGLGAQDVLIKGEDKLVEDGSFD